MQATEGILAGFLLALLVVGSGALLYLLHRLSAKLDSIEAQVVSMKTWLREGTNALNKVAEQIGVLRTLANALARSIDSMDQTTEAIRGLSGLLVTPQTGALPPQEPPPAMWTRGAPPLPNPLFDQFAKPEEAGYLEQTDEDLAEIERQNTLREQGIETDPLRIPQPDASKINFIDT